MCTLQSSSSRCSRSSSSRRRCRHNTLIFPLLLLRRSTDRRLYAHLTFIRNLIRPNPHRLWFIFSPQFLARGQLRNTNVSRGHFQWEDGPSETIFMLCQRMAWGKLSSCIFVHPRPNMTARIISSADANSQITPTTKFSEYFVERMNLLRWIKEYRVTPYDSTPEMERNYAASQAEQG